MKTPIIDKDEYTIFYEPDGHGSWVVHADVREWTPSTYRKLKREWAVLRSLSNFAPVFAVHNPSEHDDADKHIKFLSKMGFEHVSDIGEHCHLYVCQGGA